MLLVVEGGVTCLVLVRCDNILEPQRPFAIKFPVDMLMKLICKCIKSYKINNKNVSNAQSISDTFASKEYYGVLLHETLLQMGSKFSLQVLNKINFENISL
jgi:hypothetical protein